MDGAIREKTENMREPLANTVAHTTIEPMPMEKLSLIKLGISVQ